MYHTKPNYIWWNRHQTIYKRYETQKHKLSKLLNDSYDSTKTEYENMINTGYTQIYDCGNIKVQYNKK